MPDDKGREIGAGPVRTGLVLPARETTIRGGALRELVELAGRAEALGFDGVWTGDSWARSRPDPLVVLAAVAQATTTVTVGTAALQAALREPVVTATALATLDQLTDGRLVVGVGSGFPGADTDAEHAAVGLDPGDRRRRLDAAVATWRRAWAGELAELPDLPKPARTGGPPVWLAAGPPAARRAGRLYDGWLPYPPDPVDYGAGADRLGEASGGRATAALFVTVLVDDDAERARRRLDRYCQAYYGLPLELVGLVQAFVAGSPAVVRERVGRYVESGARELVVRIGALDPGPELEDTARALLSR